MANLNKVLLIGRLTRDPEMRFTPSQMAIAKMGLAVNRYRKAPDGSSIEETTFVDLTAFGKQAELAQQYLKKGRQVFIEGELKLDQWDDKATGQKRSKLEVIVNNLQFIDSAPREGGQGGEGGGGYSGGRGRGPQGGSPEGGYDGGGEQRPPSGGERPPGDDDVPF